MNERRRGRWRSDVKGKKTWRGMPDFLHSWCTPCQRWHMTHSHPDQSPTTSSRRRWDNPLRLVLCLAFTALFVAGAWFHAGLLPEFLLTLTAAAISIAELLRRGWRWNEAAVQSAWLMMCAPVLMATGGGWFALIPLAIILGAWGVWLIIRMRRRMRGDDAARAATTGLLPVDGGAMADNHGKASDIIHAPEQCREAGTMARG
jgi:hypothetical protein